MSWAAPVSPSSSIDMVLNCPMHGCSADAAVTYSICGESTMEEIRVARIGTLNFKKADIDGKAVVQNAQNPFQASMTLAPSTSVIVTVDAATAGAAEGTAELALPSLLLPFLPLPSPLFASTLGGFTPLTFAFLMFGKGYSRCFRTWLPPHDDSCTFHRTYITRLHVTRKESPS